MALYNRMANRAVRKGITTYSAIVDHLVEEMPFEISAMFAVTPKSIKGYAEAILGGRPGALVSTS